MFSLGFARMGWFKLQLDADEKTDPGPLPPTHRFQLLPAGLYVLLGLPSVMKVLEAKTHRDQPTLSQADMRKKSTP